MRCDKCRSGLSDTMLRTRARRRGLFEVLNDEVRERAQKCRIGLAGYELHGMARHDLCPRPHPGRGRALTLEWPPRVFPQAESGTEQTKI
jgi:hypothetical protein